MNLSKNATKIAIGLLLIAVAVFLVLDVFGISLGWFSAVPLWKLLIAAVFAFWSIRELCKLHVAGVFFPLAFLCILLNRELAELLGRPGRLASPWLILLVALLLSLGTSMLLPRHRLRERFGKKDKSNPHAYLHGKWNDCSARFKEQTIYVDAAKNLYTNVEVHLGAATVYFTNCESYPGGGVINVDNNLGSITLHIPADWSIESRIDNSLGSVSIPVSESCNPQKSLLLIGDNNLGSIEVKYFHAE